MADTTQLERVAVVLVAARNPLNIGAAARAMSNFGCFDLRVVNPYEIAFREARSAVGASSLLANARECKALAEAVADCTLVVGTTAATARDPQQPLFRLEEGTAQLRRQVTEGARVALVFGSEKRGLSNEDMSHCHWLMRIPTREEHGSMNLGQAVAVCLYELIRPGDVVAPPSSAAGPTGEMQAAPAVSDTLGGAPSLAGFAKGGDFDFVPATIETLERLTTLLLDCLRESGYFNPAGAREAEVRTRRLILRLNLSQQDAEMWLGMLRQMLWKIRN